MCIGNEACVSEPMLVNELDFLSRLVDLDRDS